MIIKLVRRATSKANIREANPCAIGDKNVPLTPEGIQEAQQRGKELGPEFFTKSLLYCSPYLITTQTLLWMMDGAGLWCGDGVIHSEWKSFGLSPRIYLDPLLVEVDHGYNKEQRQIDAEKELRKVHGWFYYRYKGGESPFDCYQRVSSFIESLHRQVQRKRLSRVLVVSHGFTIRCFVMRWLHLTDFQFDSLENPNNCDVITITSLASMRNPQLTSGKWGVTGLRFRDDISSTSLITGPSFVSART